MYPAVVAILAEAYAGYGVDFFDAVPMAISGGKKPPESATKPVVAAPDTQASLAMLGGLMSGTGFKGAK